MSSFESVVSFSTESLRVGLFSRRGRESIRIERRRETIRESLRLFFSEKRSGKTGARERARWRSDRSALREGAPAGDSSLFDAYWRRGESTILTTRTRPSPIGKSCSLIFFSSRRGARDLVRVAREGGVEKETGRVTQWRRLHSGGTELNDSRITRVITTLLEVSTILLSDCVRVERKFHRSYLWAPLECRRRIFATVALVRPTSLPIKRVDQRRRPGGGALDESASTR
jgi:hypothetical protein